MNKAVKFSFIVMCIIIVILAVFFGCFYGIKLTVTLDYGYVSNSETSGIHNLILSGTEGYRTEQFDLTKTVRSSYYVPPFPVRNGYTFLGWYKDTALTVPWVNGVDRVKSNITLYAKWKEVE